MSVTEMLHAGTYQLRLVNIKLLVAPDESLGLPSSPMTTGKHTVLNGHLLTSMLITVEYG